MLEVAIASPFSGTGVGDEPAIDPGWYTGGLQSRMRRPKKAGIASIPLTRLVTRARRSSGPTDERILSVVLTTSFRMTGEEGGRKNNQADIVNGSKRCASAAF